MHEDFKHFGLTLLVFVNVKLRQRLIGLIEKYSLVLAGECAALLCITVLSKVVRVLMDIPRYDFLVGSSLQFQVDIQVIAIYGRKQLEIYYLDHILLRGKTNSLKVFAHD